MTTEKPHYSRKPIGSVRALAFVTGTSTGHLRDLARTAPKSYRVVRRDGKIKVTYEPAESLKKLQRKLIDVLLAEVVFPSYTIGGVRKHSYGDDSALHVCAENVIKLDISTFYESVSRQEIRKLWQQFFNFPPEVAELLTDLTTYRGRLPRGAPTSSYLANLLLRRAEVARRSHPARH